MAQHDYVIDNASGATVRADINSALSAIQTLNSGTSAPSSTAAGMLWLDTSGGAPYALKVRDAGNNHWLTLASVTDPGSDGNIETSATIKGTIDSSADLTNANFPNGHVIRTDHAYEDASDWIETTSTSYQPSGIIVNAGTVSTGESVILNCTIRNSSPVQANLSATFYHKIGTGGTYADLLTNAGSAGGERFFLQHYSTYPIQPFTMYFAHTSPSTSDDNYYQIYFRSSSSGNKARLAWYSSGIEITAQRVKFNSSTDLTL